MKYFCLPDNTMKQVPDDFRAPIFEQLVNELEKKLSNQPAIHTDGSFKPGEVVDGSEIEISRWIWHEGDYYSKCKICKGQFIGDKRQQVCKDCCEKGLFATRKSEAGKGKKEESTMFYIKHIETKAVAAIYEIEPDEHRKGWLRGKVVEIGLDPNTYIGAQWGLSADHVFNSGLYDYSKNGFSLTSTPKP